MGEHKHKVVTDPHTHTHTLVQRWMGCGEFDVGVSMHRRPASAVLHYKKKTHKPPLGLAPEFRSVCRPRLQWSVAPDTAPALPWER